MLPALPLTPNGKVDRKALPAPEPERANTDAPRNPTEEKLCLIWSEVLGLKALGVHDNFFDLGGHSLLATRLAARIREVLKIDVPLRSLFETQTLGDLSALIAEREMEQAAWRRLEAPATIGQQDEAGPARSTPIWRTCIRFC